MDSRTPSDRRHLAAVWFADIVGFSRLASANEDDAVRLVEAFHACATASVSSNGGRVVNFIGDAALAEFHSTEQAARAACELVADFEARTGARLRVGLHVGDVAIGEDNDLLGDGVNIAARLQVKAGPGEVVASEDAWRQLRQREGFRFDELGRRRLRGQSHSVRIFRVCLRDEVEVLEGAHVAAPLATPSLRTEAAADEPPLRDGAGEPSSAPPSALPGSRIPGAVRRFAPLFIPVIVLGLLVAMMMWGGNGRPGGAETVADEPVTAIAVLPFSYRGPPEDAYLADGLVTLISTSLNGAGGLRTINPYAILSRSPAAEDDAVPLSPGEAGEVAADLGADIFLVGTVAASSGQFHLYATLYGQGSPPQVLQVATVEAEDPVELVDGLVRVLLLRHLNEPADRLTQLAAVTTGSLPALKAYLEGERAFRSARYDDAVQALQQAVREDPDFAFAQYRLSTAAEWSFDFPEARRAADEAQRLSARLSGPDRRLITAWHTFIHGDAERAEQLYQAILTDSPEDVEARSGLGEVLIHYNHVRGRARAEAATHFERVLKLAPDFGEARFHLMELAAEQGRIATFDSLLAGVDPASTQGAAWKVTREIAGRSSEAREAILDSLGTAEDDLVLAVAAARTAAHFRDLDGAQGLAALLTDADRPADWRAAGLIMSAQGQVARGRWTEADSTLRMALPLEPAWTLEMRALALLLPDASPTDAALRSTRADLLAWDPHAEDSALPFFFATHADAHAELRLYLLALLSLRLRDGATAERYLAELRQRGEGLAGIGISLANSVAAHRAWLNNDPATALRILEADAPRIPLERIALSPFFSRALDRHLRADALAALGRIDEALAWYASLTEGPDLLFWAPALRREAELLRRAGRPAEAAAHEDRLQRILSRPAA